MEKTKEKYMASKPQKQKYMKLDEPIDENT